MAERVEELAHPAEEEAGGGPRVETQRAMAERAEDPAHPAAEEAGGGITLSYILRMFILWSIMSTVLRGGRGGSQQQQQQQQQQQHQSPDGAIAARSHHRPKFRSGAKIDLRVIIARAQPQLRPPTEADVMYTWEQKALFFDWRDSSVRNSSISVPVSKHMLANGSVHAHVSLALEGFSHDPTSQHFHADKQTSVIVPLTVHRQPPAARNEHNLLGNSADSGRLLSAGAELQRDEPRGAQLFWKPKLALSLVHDFTEYPRGGIPPHVRSTMRFDAQGDYYPVIYGGGFWEMQHEQIAINASLSHAGASVPLELSFSMLGPWKWQLFTSMEQQWRQQEALGLQKSGQNDEFKRMILETNPVLLGVTFTVSILHTLFDFLAFKNDVQFWRKNKSLEGLSLRTVGLNCFFQLIILLYLFDNDTSWMILGSSCVGLVIELWKLRKAVRVEVTWPPGVWVPSLRIISSSSYTTGGANSTATYDRIAVEHLLYIVWPLVIGMAAYSLAHSVHKSWYSWILNSLTQFIYVFGFVMMTPQLFINYKLKSVAHLPWRAMVYKALNTFIDDLFAFVIKMPTMHRLSCFRDDIIFFIMLYQRYIYPVDKTRPNEFGRAFKAADGEEDTHAAPVHGEDQVCIQRLASAED